MSGEFESEIMNSDDDGFDNTNLGMKFNLNMNIRSDDTLGETIHTESNIDIDLD